MDFGDLGYDGLIDTGALSSATSEAELEQIKQIAPQKILKDGPSPNFQYMVANRQMGTPIATTELQFQLGDITIVERFKVMANLAKLLLGLFFSQRNGTVLDMRQEILNLPSFSMQLKDADTSYPNINEFLLNPHEIVLQPGKQTIIWVKPQIYKELEVTRILQPPQHIENNDEIIICPAKKSNKNRICKFQDHP